MHTVAVVRSKKYELPYGGELERQRSDHFEFSTAGPMAFLVPNSKRFGNIRQLNLVNYIVASLVQRIYLFFESDSSIIIFFLGKIIMCLFRLIIHRDLMNQRLEVGGDTSLAIRYSSTKNAIVCQSDIKSSLAKCLVMLSSSDFLRGN